MQFHTHHSYKKRLGLFFLGDGRTGAFEVGNMIVGVGKVRDHTTYNSISRDVEGCTETIHEPINGEDEFESIRSSCSVEDGVVRGDDQHQRSRRYGCSTDRTNGRNNDKQNVMGGVHFETIEDGQPNRSAREIDSSTCRKRKL